jgi:hypothetical protein
MASGTWNFFYRAVNNEDSGVFILQDGVNLVSEGTVTFAERSGSVNDLFVFNERLDVTYEGATGLPSSLFFQGGINGEKQYLVFYDFLNEGYYIATNVEITDTDSFEGRTVSDSIPFCFFPGTLISTPNGDRAVEALKIGDLVCTQSGHQKLKFLARSTNWIGILRNTGRMPVCITAGAFGDCGPRRDLWLSPSHAVLLGDHLVEAGALCNGTTVQQADDLDQMMITYYNLEFEQHEIIQANGLAIESYYANWRSTGLSRSDWDNYADYVALYGEGGPMRELELPRIPFARQLPASVRELIGAQPLLAG